MSTVQAPCKIGIFGAGAIGLDLGVQLIEAGHRVTFIARDETLTALKQEGIVYRSNDTQRLISPERYSVTNDTHQAGEQKYLFLTVKADSLLPISKDTPPLLQEDSTVLSLTNGIPPWYSYQQDHTIGRFLDNLTPRETFLNNIPPDHIVGGIVQRSVNKDGPNFVTHTSGTGYTIGEPTHKILDRTKALQSLLENAGLTASISTNIHRDIWTKLLGNVCVNPMSVITGSTIGQMLEEPAVESRMKKVVEEAKEVGVRLGVIAPDDYRLETFLDYARTHLADHETSMLQDFKKGRSLEVHRIVEVIIMLGQLEGVNVEMPFLQEMRDDLQEKIRSREIEIDQQVRRELTP